MKRRRAQAELLARQADEALLVSRLRGLGFQPSVQVHANRSVLVSMTERGALRVHRGFAYANDRILKAIVLFVDAGVTRATRKRAARELGAFPVDQYVPCVQRKQRGPIRSRDRQLIRELKALHEQLNQDHFAGQLRRVPFRISDRMLTSLGEITIDDHSNRVVEIAISRRHVEHDARSEVAHTVLHEMVHQWQAESRMDIDHGPDFKRKARELGLDPRASRIVESVRYQAQGFLGGIE